MIQKTNPKLAVAYVRMSKDEQKNSPPAQGAAIEAWAKREGVTVIATCFDLGVSGGDALEDRPGILFALGLMRERGAGVLLVAKRDRLARDVLTAAMVERLVERAHARVLTASGEGNGDGPEAMMLRGMLDVFAMYERLVIKARTKAALGVKRSKRERVGAVPYGYAVAGGTAERLGGSGVQLAPVESEQAVIREARRLRSGGRSLDGIAADLAARGVTSRTGRPFQAVQIMRMIA